MVHHFILLTFHLQPDRWSSRTTTNRRESATLPVALVRSMPLSTSSGLQQHVFAEFAMWELWESTQDSVSFDRTEAAALPRGRRQTASAVHTRVGEWVVVQGGSALLSVASYSLGRFRRRLMAHVAILHQPIRNASGSWPVRVEASVASHALAAAPLLVGADQYTSGGACACHAHRTFWRVSLEHAHAILDALHHLLHRHFDGSRG